MIGNITNSKRYLIILKTNFKSDIHIQTFEPEVLTSPRFVLGPGC